MVIDDVVLQVTVASVGGCVSAQQVHKKVCDALGMYTCILCI